MSFVVLAAVMLGCSDDRGSNEETETGEPTTGDGDGDPTTGDGDGDGEPTTGDGDGAPVGECSSADECVLVNDCCTCDVVLAGDEPPCDVPECFAPTCDAIGYTPEPACFVGTCVAAPVSCQLYEVTCEIEPPPPCEGGLVRSVDNMCYGPCVPPSMCESLPFECDAATCGEGYACMVTQSGASGSCIPLPPGCNGTPSCDCVAPWWGEIDCGGSCGDLGDVLLCEDGG